MKFPNVAESMAVLHGGGVIDGRLSCFLDVHGYILKVYSDARAEVPAEKKSNQAFAAPLRWIGGQTVLVDEIPSSQVKRF